jgi:hypothetical protein
LREDTTNGFASVNARLDQLEAEVRDIKRRFGS